MLVILTDEFCSLLAERGDLSVVCCMGRVERGVGAKNLHLLFGKIFPKTYLNTYFLMN